MVIIIKAVIDINNIASFPTYILIAQKVQSLVCLVKQVNRPPF